jgi:hypothetical protein
MTTQLAKCASWRDTWQVGACEMLERRAAIIRGERKISWLTTHGRELGIRSPPDEETPCAMTPLSLYHIRIALAAVQFSHLVSMQSHRQSHPNITGRFAHFTGRKPGNGSPDEYRPKHRLQFRTRQTRLQAQVDHRLESQSQGTRYIDALTRDLLRCL